MVINKNVIKGAGINPDIYSDLQFSVYDTGQNNLIGTKYKDLDKATSVGSIQTILEMNMLMSKSLSILSPNLVFAPDFPDYLMSEDNPDYMKTIPMINPELYTNMPHFRNDLYERDFTDYKTIDKVPAPAITWGVVRSEPGTVSGSPFSGTKEVKGRERELALVFHKDYESILKQNSDINSFISTNTHLYKFIKVKGQFFDNLVQYNTWTRSNWEAEELVEWFQKDYMIPYTGMFREAGINDMYFQRRVRDDTLLQRSSKYHLRSMLYYIRTEFISNESIMPISRIDTDIDVLTSGSDIIVNNELHNYYDNILDRWHS